MKLTQWFSKRAAPPPAPEPLDPVALVEESNQDFDSRVALWNEVIEGDAPTVGSNR